MSVEVQEIGSLSEAEVLANVRRVWDFETPEGWRKIGEGSYRKVFLSPSGVAYKIGTDECNRFEDTKARECREMPPLGDVRIPQTTLYEFEDNTVLAMEFVKGVIYKDSGLCDCDYKWCDFCSDVYREIGNYFGLSDMHAANIMVTDNDAIYVIDLGEY